jgi:hypothetical protein
MEPFAYDWAGYDVAKVPQMEVWCVCGKVYVSHYALVKEQGKYITITRDPCPACGLGWNHVVKVKPISLIQTLQ